MIYAIAAVIILILDQGLKYWTSSNLALGEGVKELLPGILHLTNYRNTGVAFGLFGDLDMRWILVALAVVFGLIIALLLAARRIQGGFGRVTAVIVLAGALGNAIDRAVHGYVVDMLELEFINFPIFNLADICLTLGGVLFCLYIIFHADPETQVKKPPDVRRRVPSAPVGSVGSIEQLSRPNVDEMTGKLPSLGARGAEQGRPRVLRDDALLGQTESRPQPEVPAPRVSQTARPPAPAPKPVESGFTLEDILSEFGDK